MNHSLCKLPQELYDDIFDLVFTADSEVRSIDKHYRLPAQMHVSRATQEKFARSYYGEGTFLLREQSGKHTWSVTDLTATCNEWLDKLDNVERPLMAHYWGFLLKDVQMQLSRGRCVGSVMTRILEARLESIRRLGTFSAIWDHFPGVYFVAAPKDPVRQRLDARNASAT